MFSRYTAVTLLREVVLWVGAAAMSVPLYLVVTISLKTSSSAAYHPFAFPPNMYLGNYSTAWQGTTGTTLGAAMLNSFIITAGAIALLVAFGSVGAYALARRPGRLGNGLYLLFVIGIIIPWQVGVVPLYVAMLHLGLVGNRSGMIILYTGLEMPFTVFLYTGFVRALAVDYEEAARVDGAGLLRTFVFVVFPLLRPVTVTVAVFNVIIIWNDFFLQLIFTVGSGSQTLPVTLYTFVSQNTLSWGLIFAGVAIALAPIMCFFLVAQGRLAQGFASGVRG